MKRFIIFIVLISISACNNNTNVINDKELTLERMKTKVKIVLFPEDCGIVSIYEDKNIIWFSGYTPFPSTDGNFKGVLYRFDGSTIQKVFESTNTHCTFRNLTSDNNGFIWMIWNDYDSWLHEDLPGGFITVNNNNNINLIYTDSLNIFLQIYGHVGDNIIKDFKFDDNNKMWAITNRGQLLTFYNDQWKLIASTYSDDSLYDENFELINQRIIKIKNNVLYLGGNKNFGTYDGNKFEILWTSESISDYFSGYHIDNRNRIWIDYGDLTIKNIEDNSIFTLNDKVIYSETGRYDLIYLITKNGKYKVPFSGLNIKPDGGNTDKQLIGSPIFDSNDIPYMRPDGYDNLSWDAILSYENNNWLIFDIGNFGYRIIDNFYVDSKDNKLIISREPNKSLFILSE